MFVCKNEDNHYFKPDRPGLERYLKRSVLGKTGMIVEELIPIIRLRCSTCGFITSLDTDMFDNARWLTRLQDELSGVGQLTANKQGEEVSGR